MTSNSERPTVSRFRSGNIGANATPAQRLERLLDDGERMYALFEELCNDALSRQHVEELDELLAVTARSADPQRVYQARRYAASALRALSDALPHDDRFLWAAPHDRIVALLVPALEEEPHEPELLNMLGASVYELGHTKLARRVFEAVREIDPTHQHARANLRACKERMQRAHVVASVPERCTPTFTATRTQIKRIAERAARLQDRTVSVVMIVKDEEEMLPGCLAPLVGHVDQIVIVDTGSTDRTREIAREYGAEVHEFAWTGSFSDARNHALSFATGDWAIWLDADEHVVAEDADQFRTLARRTWVEGFHIIETHFTGSGDVGGEATHAPMRMFQRRPQYFWKGEVHEQLLGNFPTWLPERFQQTSIRVDHFGYLSTVVDARDKHERNLDLLMQQVQHDRSAFTCFNIGTEHASMNDWAEAHRWFEEAIRIARETDAKWQEQQFAPLMVQRTINALRNLGRTNDAIALANDALTWWPGYTDLVYELAATHAQLGDWITTETEARRALAMGDAPARFVSTTGKGSYQARGLLAAALRQQNRVEECCAELERAQEEAPTFFGMLIDLTDALLETRGVDAASARVDELLGDRAHGATVNVLVAAAFHDAGEFAAAEERYQRVLGPHPTHSGALIARAELRLAQRDFDAAYVDAMTIDPLDIVASRAAQAAFLAAVVLDDADRVVHALERIETAQELPAAERAVYVAWKELATGSTGVSTLVPAESAAAATVLRNLEALAKLEATDQFEALHPLLAQVQPDERLRHLQLAELYLRRQFVDMAGEEYMTYVQQFGPDPVSLTGLGKVATMKEMWEDAEVLLGESLGLDPEQPEASRLLTAIQTRQVV